MELLKFTTARDHSGNRYCMQVDLQKKVCKRSYNIDHCYSDYIQIRKKDLYILEQVFENNGFIVKHV